MDKIYIDNTKLNKAINFTLSEEEDTNIIVSYLLSPKNGLLFGGV